MQTTLGPDFEVNCRCRQREHQTGNKGYILASELHLEYQSNCVSSLSSNFQTLASPISLQLYVSPVSPVTSASTKTLLSQAKRSQNCYTGIVNNSVPVRLKVEKRNGKRLIK